MKIILIRHGESEANAFNAIKDNKDKIFIGQWNCGLTEHGKEQALRLRGDPIFKNADAFFCSDLKRAVDTARLLTDRDITIDKRLRERCLGIFEGEKIEEIKNNPLYSDYFNNPEYSQFRHGFTVRAPGGENYSDVCERVSSFLNELDKNYGKIVIVAHFCAIRCIIKTVKNLSREETLNLKVYNCEPIIIDYNL